MNLFRFLKSTKGAIKPLNALLISGAAGAVFAYTVNTAADKQIAAERSVRTLASIEGTAPQQGLRRQGDLLTSINVRDGRGQLATPEERAAMKGSSPLDRYEANQRALNNMDANLGRAAAFAQGEDGLNTGNRNAVQSPDRYIVGNPNANAAGDNVSNVYRRASADANGGGSGAARLAPASVTRTSGNSFGGTSGAVSGGISSQGGTRGGAEGPARLSGAMPGGSNIVSQRTGAGLGTNNNTSSFGGNRNARMTRGHKSGSDANELKDIVKKSAAAASNANASANEGGRAFLASAVNSGGVSVDGGEDMARGASSGDLTAPTNRKLKAIGNKLQQVENEQEKRKKAHRRLILMLLGVTAGSLVILGTGTVTLANIKHNMSGPWSTVLYWAVAAVMIAAVATLANTLFVAAKHFISDYGSSGGTKLAVASQIIAGILAAAAVFVAIKPEPGKDFLKKQWDTIKNKYLTKQGFKENVLNKWLDKGLDLAKAKAAEEATKIMKG